MRSNQGTEILDQVTLHMVWNAREMGFYRLGPLATVLKSAVENIAANRTLIEMLEEQITKLVEQMSKMRELLEEEESSGRR